MNRDKSFSFAQRWRALEGRSKSLDYDKSVWSRECRAECRSDEAFVKWCADELGLTSTQADELLLRATACKAIPDAETWRKVGGFREIRALEDVPDRRTQVHIIESAKSTGKGIRTLVREYSPRPAEPRANPFIDAEQLAKFIASHLKVGDLPAPIRSIVIRYAVVVEAKKAA